MLCLVNSAPVNCTVATKPTQAWNPTSAPAYAVSARNQCRNSASTNAETTLAASEPAYPANFVLSPALDVSFVSYPISFIHGFANGNGEYHKNPTSIVESAAASTARKLR